MLFGIDGEENTVEPIPPERFDTLDIWERRDLQQWILEETRILGEELLVVDDEYENFVETADRLDILALDTDGELVVVELKRDEADDTTDLQAVKYASYCATLTAEDIQKDYRNTRTDDGEDIAREEVGDRFADHLDGADTDVRRTEEGWIDFDLSNTPRIMLAAGSFSTEITSPVMWLREEYDMDIDCIQLEAYEHAEQVLLSSRRIIPIPEAEEYMARRRRKDRESESTRSSPTVNRLLDRGVLIPDDVLYFDPSRVPGQTERDWDPDADYWQARVTGDTGRSAVKWLHDKETYSFTRLTKVMLEELVGRDPDKSLNGYKYWCHPEYGGRTLADLGAGDMEGEERLPTRPSEYFDEGEQEIVAED